MTKAIIEIQGIGKRYRLGAVKERYLSLRDEMVKWLSPTARRARADEEEFWALKDVSFSVEPGEVVGIIGSNGAGKSTLLKILSQITPPSEGKITCRGRIASLLEVGTGFHPELTGRENIYMNGAILGMSRGEIARKFDEIVAFAEMEKFLDTPAKRYSSGMYVRLAFAVAAHLEPEILVIDEVLAVGDAQFQKKCLDKMGEVAKGGRTVLFVSHNMAALSQLCSRAALLKKGRVALVGSVDTVIEQYLAPALESAGHIAFRDAGTTPSPGIEAEFLSLTLENDQGNVTDTFFIGEPLVIRARVVCHREVSELQMAFNICSIRGMSIFHCMSRDAAFRPRGPAGLLEFTVRFPALKLYPGSYIIDKLWLADASNNTLTLNRDCLGFHVLEGGPHLYRGLLLHEAVVHEVPEWAAIIQGKNTLKDA